MSLISIRNFFGPYKNKVQMGGLIIAVILVLVIRMGTSKNSTKDVDVQESGNENLLGVLNKTRRDDSSARPSRTTDDVLDELMDEKFDDRPSKQAANDNKNESFQDIRKSLGLE
jgi:hypothetical protein